ncbi:hypothetical protein JTE90_007296, partial [Oedothorax gibbosus]
MKAIENLWKTVNVIFTMKICCVVGRTSDVFPPDYNKHESPGYQGHPAHVYLELNILDIDRIDESRMEFSIQTYVEERWNDWRLNLSSYVGEYVEVFPQTLLQDLWVPDLMFDNAKSGVLFDLSVPNTIVEVYKDGSLSRLSSAHISNRCPTKGVAVNKTSYELFFDRKPTASYFKVFGQKAFVSNKLKKSKFEPRSHEVIFIGYSDQAKAYHFFDPNTRNVIVSRYAKFIDEINQSFEDDQKDQQWYDFPIEHTADPATETHGETNPYGL